MTACVCSQDQTTGCDVSPLGYRQTLLHAQALALCVDPRGPIHKLDNDKKITVTKMATIDYFKLQPVVATYTQTVTYLQ